MLRKPVPKTQKAKRALKEREPKVVENVKTSLVLKGSKSSDIISKALRDVHMLKKPNSKMFIRKNATRPFEDQTSVEFLARTNDTSLFAFGSHTKKRPHNLIMGRLFDFQILDMIEFGLEPTTFKSMQEFSSGRQGVVRVGSKPCFVFQGEEFEKNEDFIVIKSLFLDYFRGEVLDQLNLAGVDRVMVLTAMGDKLFFRHYSIAFKRSGTKLPKVELEEVGPTLDLTFRRRKSAAADVQKASMRQPKTAPEKPKKVKNIEEGQFGDKVGRVHKGKQDFTKIALSKRKALKRPKEDAGAVAAAPTDDGLAPPSQPKRVKPTPKKGLVAASAE